MIQNVKILFAFDSEDEIKPIVNHLSKEGINSISTVTKTKEEINKAFLTSSPDIIISDCCLKGFDAKEVLRMKGEHTPLTPFILIGDCTDGETVADLIKSGADDFVLRENFARLVRSVRELLKKRKAENESLILRAELEKTRMLFNSLLDYSPIYIFFKDKDSRIIKLSRNYEDILGFPSEKAEGKNMYEIFPEEIAEQRMKEDHEIIENWKSIKVIEELNGRVFETLKFPVDVPGIGICIAGFITDITDRKVAENELQQERNLLRKLIDNIPDLINIKDSSGRYIINNLPHMKSVGIERQEDITGKTPLDFFPPEEAAIYSDDDKKVIETGIPIIDKEECSVQKDTMSAHWYLTSKIPLTDKEGRVTHLITISHDITERKKSQEIISYERNLLRTLIDNLPDAIYIKDNEGRKVMANKADVENIGAASEQDVIGKTDLELFSWQIGLRGYNDDISVLKRGEKIINKEEDFIDRNGKKRWLLTTKLPIYDEKGNIKGLVGIGRDITAIKEATLELIKAKEKAEESDRLKTAFLNNISHEIRTPMNAIVGFSSLLKDPETGEEERNSYIDIIIQSSNNLLAIINDIIEISHIEAGIRKINYTSTDLNSLMSNILLQFSKKAEGKGLKLEFSPGLTGIEAKILTDPAKLTQILTNLVSNALKYTLNGKIEFGYKLKEELLEFFVSDTGIGIPEEHFENIFKRFVRIDNELTQKLEGTGLGLAISKGLVELLGGKIWLTSTPGKGTSFYFTIPYNTSITNEKKGKTVTEKQFNRKSATIIVAEDDVNSFIFIKALLSKYDIELIHTKTGRETIETIKSGIQADLILMDIKMPECDGYEATIEIKKIAPTLPVIALTAFAFPEEKEKALNAGFDDYLVKPVKTDEIISIINKYIKFQNRND